MTTATVCRYRNGRILQADLRETRAVSRRLAMLPPETCWTFGGWIVWPFAYTGGQATHRIRKMCTNAVLYPCAWYDETGWHSDGTETAVRLDTYSPTLGHEPSYPGTAPRSFAAGGDVPNEWPYVDTCNGCWNFHTQRWFPGSVPSDWNFEDRGFQLLEIMQDQTDERRTRKFGPPQLHYTQIAAPVMDWPCFADQVAPGALVSLALTIEVFKQQDKTTGAYGDLVNLFVTGKISVRVPLIGSS